MILSIAVRAALAIVLFDRTNVLHLALALYPWHFFLTDSLSLAADVYALAFQLESSTTAPIALVGAGALITLRYYAHRQ